MIRGKPHRGSKHNKYEGAIGEGYRLITKSEMKELYEWGKHVMECDSTGMEHQERSHEGISWWSGLWINGDDDCAYRPEYWYRIKDDWKPVVASKIGGSE